MEVGQLFAHSVFYKGCRMTNTIVKVKDGYGLDVWGNYLSIKMDKNKVDNQWYYSSILILQNKEEIEKAKLILEEN